MFLDNEKKYGLMCHIVEIVQYIANNTVNPPLLKVKP